MTAQSQMALAAKEIQAGRYKQALRAAKSALRLAPKHAQPANMAGIALSGMGRPQDALVYFNRAMKLDPGFADAKKNAAQTLLLAGQPKPALVLLRKLSVDMPGDATVLYLLAQAAAANGVQQEALSAATACIACPQPSNRAYKLRAKLRLEAGLIPDALEDYDKALEHDPNDVEVLTLMSLPMARVMRTQDALSCVTRATELDPSYIPARLRLANQYVEMRQTDDAVAQYQRVLQLDPGQPDALERLCELLRGQELSALDKPVRTALKTAPKRSEARACLFYAAARIKQGAGDRADADKMLAAANKEMASIYKYDADADDAMAASIMSRFSDPVPAGDGIKHTPTPIFVIGLPRSGTTLAEAVLGRHPNVAPFGELGTAGFLLKPVIDDALPFDTNAMTAFLQDDARLLPPVPDGCTHYVDKMPENYRIVGFLKAAYPGCKIIHMSRDPRDTALSIWKSHFSGPALAYSYALPSMAHRFNLYARMMAHWHRIFADQILTLRYEDLVTDIDGQSRRMAQYCGLDWAPEMLRPDLSTAQVLTLSATQLGRPVHSDSIGKWQHSAEALEPFIRLLSPDLWPEIAQ